MGLILRFFYTPSPQLDRESYRLEAWTCSEEAGDFRSLGCFGNPDHWGGHDFSSGELRVPEENAVLLTGDRKFESISLRRGVMCEPDSSIGAELSAPSGEPRVNMLELNLDRQTH